MFYSKIVNVEFFLVGYFVFESDLYSDFLSWQIMFYCWKYKLGSFLTVAHTTKSWHLLFENQDKFIIKNKQKKESQNCKCTVQYNEVTCGHVVELEVDNLMDMISNFIHGKMPNKSWYSMHFKRCELLGPLSHRFKGGIFT